MYGAGRPGVMCVCARHWCVRCVVVFSSADLFTGLSLITPKLKADHKAVTKRKCEKLLLSTQPQDADSMPAESASTHTTTGKDAARVQNHLPGAPAAMAASTPRP
jgi:hypothetical protein